MTRLLLEAQLETCKRFSAIHFPFKDDDTVYFATATRGLLPVNGERINSENGESGWYIWCGVERKDDESFFEKISLYELSDRAPLVQAFLGLPPGYRFLIAGGHQKAWYDTDLKVQPIT